MEPGTAELFHVSFVNIVTPGIFSNDISALFYIMFLAGIHRTYFLIEVELMFSFFICGCIC